MKCAFLICVYGKDDVCHLDEALASVITFSQTKHYEINIYLHVDGKVSQQHLDVINKINPYKIIHSKNNVGLAIGLNKLIEQLEDEEYIFRMDADDICCEDRIALQVQYLEENNDVDLLGGSIEEFVGSQENIVAYRNYPSLASAYYLPKGSPFAHVTICFRKRFFEKFGCYPINYPLNEDIALWGKALLMGAVGHNIPDTLVKVRMDSAYSRRTFKKASSELRVYLKICKDLKVLPIYPIARFIFRLLPISIVESVYRSDVRNSFLKS
ncbi:glycosyltransferase [Photobacterium arenosum]|uniref:glycosyltransferase n=1 Tax=Photobacterium arenosum TaxID=2774143 RepID=UPI002889941D|nr:glycosyltransferase [Photobacterium arenosum]